MTPSSSTRARRRAPHPGAEHDHAALLAAGRSWLGDDGEGGGVPALQGAQRGAVGQYGAV